MSSVARILTVLTKTAVREPTMYPKIAPNAGVNGHAWRKSEQPFWEGIECDEPAKDDPNQALWGMPHSSSQVQPQ